MLILRAKRLGHLLFAVGMAGLGFLSLLFGDFAMNWQPVPDWVPLRACLAYLSGALLLATGVGLLVKRWAARSALILTLFLLSWLLLLQIPRVASDPKNESMWLGFGETLVLVAGAWVLFTYFRDDAFETGDASAAAERDVRIGRLSFAIALPLIGLSHFVYSGPTASMVPAWLPAHLGFAYLTGAGHIAAGFALLFSVLPRLAATLEAVMISLFVLLLHLPGVLAAPRDRLQWTMLFVASALAGASWAVAGSVSDRPWIRARR